MSDFPAATLTATLRDGTELAIQRAGTGPALLLLPGQGNDHTWWDGLREAFEPHFTTLTFDYRGTGGTRAAEEDWSTGSFALDAVAVLDACEVERAHVYGTSMGGRVAQMVAAQDPERVDRLVLAATSPGGTAAPGRSEDVRRSLAEPNPARRVQTLLHLLYTPAWFGRGRHSRLTGDASMTPRARNLHLRASDAHDAADLLADVVAPTLVLHGDDDEMAPVAGAHALAERVPGAELQVTAGGRHGFFDEFAEDVSARVTDFLGPQGAQRPAGA